MKNFLVVLLVAITGNLAYPQKITDYKKPWFENRHAGDLQVKSKNPLLDNYDVKFYWLDINATNTSKTISGSGTIYAKVVNNPLTTLILELINSLTVDSVFIDGTLHSFTHQNDEITVNLSQPVNVNNYFTVKVYYHGTSSGNGIRNGTSPSWGAQITWTLSESYHAKDWFPCKQSLTDKADSAYVFITCANNLKAGSNGLLKNVVTLPGSKLRYEWKTYYPIDYYLLSFTISNYQEYNIYAHPAGTSDSLFIQNYIYSNSGYLPYFQTEIDNTVAFIELLSDLYGLYPFMQEKYGHCTAPIGGGMEHQTMTTLSYFDFELVIHELGHQWFGDNVTCSNWQDIWINEGFATYTHYIGLQNLISQSQASQVMLDIHSDVKSSPGGSIYVPLADIFDEGRIFDYRLSYEKGAAIIHTIRFILNNNSLFYNVLKTFQQNFTDSTASAEDFKNTLQSLSGIDFTDFFDHWYYGEGFPTYNITWNQQGSAVNLMINQQSSMPGVTPFFKVPLEIKFNWAGGDTVIRFDQTVNNQVFSANISQTVQSLQVDPDNWIINNTGSIVVGIPETDVNDDFYLYPNPASEEINICNVNGNFSLFDVTITDISGREAGIPGNCTGIIDISDLKEGVYFVNIKKDDINITKRFIKQGR